MTPPNQFVYLTSGCCESTPHWNSKKFKTLGLGFQAKTRHGAYPLTAKEEKYISETALDACGGIANFAYTYYSRGRKFFGPEIYFMTGSPGAAPVKAQRAAILIVAKKALAILEPAAAQFGGTATLTADDESGDRHIIRCFCPMDTVIKKRTPQQWTNYWLKIFKENQQ